MILFIKNVKEEGPGIIETYFSGKGYDTLTVELSDGETLPEKLEGIEAVVSMGGSMNVYEREKYPFLSLEEQFIKEVITKDIPFLGICLGAQLLAKAAGADIVKSPVGETGFFDVTISHGRKRDPLLSGFKNVFKVFQWHEDMFNIPVNGIRLAENDNCVNQAFKIGQNAYGIQFHLEADQTMVLEWMKAHYEDDPGEFEIFKEETARTIPEVLETGQLMCRNFERIIKKCFMVPHARTSPVPVL